MNQNSIHEADQIQKHWAGQYFGPLGLLVEARQKLASNESDLQSVPKTDDSLFNAVINAKMALISRLFSAIGHCFSQVIRLRPNNKIWFAREGVRLSVEMNHLVDGIYLHECMLDRLEAGSRDVLIAALMFLAKPTFNASYMEVSKELIDKTLRESSYDSPSYYFALARATKHSMFSWSEHRKFKKEVYEVVTHHGPDGDCPLLGWTDVARLARLIGDNKRKRYAAMKHGSSEAMLKAGMA
jgi:hypothetical protein